LSGTVLITGATGFVGQGLVAHLKAEGRPLRLALRAGDGDGSVAVGDIGPETDWSRALDGVDIVVHLAGRAHVMAKERDALAQFRKVNTAGTRRLAEQAERAGVRRFVLISSVKAAADTTGSEHAILETEPPDPRSPYGISKLEGERALWDAARSMDAVVLRPPLVYGPGVRANFRALLRLVDSGLPLPLGAVRNRRSMIARDNLVSAIAAATTASGVPGKTFYVTEAPPLSTPTLIRGLAKALGKPARLISFSPALIGALAVLAGRRETADSLLGSLAISGLAFRAATGWMPPVAQEAAFDDVANWYRQEKARF
jgi:nucleoside-diphosphate-sugar epimerase